MGKNKIKLGGNIGNKGGGSFEFSTHSKKISGEEKTNIVINGVESLKAVIDGVLSLVKEKENTKKIQIEQNTNMKKLDNELESILSQERIELEKIDKEYKLNYKQLENESEKNRLQAQIIQMMLTRISNLELKVNHLEETYGFDNELVLKLSDQLHQESMNLTNQLQLQG